jgi:hypothetical protein
MYSTQTIFAAVSCTFGVLMLLVARHQKLNHDIGNVPLVSWLTKHIVGLLLLIISILVFLSQFIVRE